MVVVMMTVMNSSYFWAAAGMGLIGKKALVSWKDQYPNYYNRPHKAIQYMKF